MPTDETDILSQLEDLKKENSTLKDKLKGFENLSNDNKSAEELLDETQGELQKVQTSLQSVTSERDKAIQEKGELQKRFDGLTSENKSLKEKNESLEIDMKDFNGKLSKELSKYGISRDPAKPAAQENPEASEQGNAENSEKGEKNYTQLVQQHKAKI